MTKNSGKQAEAPYLMPMTGDHDLLSALPDRGRVRSARVNGKTAIVIGDVSGLDDKERSAIEQRWRSAALKMSGITEARIALTAASSKRQVIAVASGKGGVGKSTVAVNLAVALSRSGRKVGLIDADVYGPSQPTLLGNTTKPEARKEKLSPVEAHGIRFLSVGQIVNAGQALAWRGPMASSALNQLIEADWDDCDTLVVDLPPGTGDIQISLIQKARPDGAVIVSTSQDLSLIDAERAVDLFNKVQVPVLGVIENMAGYSCPHCGKQSDPFGSGGGEESAKAMHVPFLGRLPLSLAIRTASDRGEPPAAGDGPGAAEFAEIAAKVVNSLDKVGA